MENIVFDRDYTQTTEEKELAAAEWMRVQNTLTSSVQLQQYEDVMRRVPKIVVPAYRENYDYLLQLCDSLAKRYCGSVHGVIDYQYWSAKIDLIVPFIDFVSDEQLSILKDIADKSFSVTIQSATNGGIRVNIRCDYFEDMITDLDKSYIEFETLLNDREVASLLGVDNDTSVDDALSCVNIVRHALDYMVRTTGMSRHDCYKELVSLMDDKEGMQALVKKAIEEIIDSPPTNEII